MLCPDPTNCLGHLNNAYIRPLLIRPKIHWKCPDPSRSFFNVRAFHSHIQSQHLLFVLLSAGETVFYNNNILHCATYDPNQKRATLHACIGDTRGGATRARNILQHGLFWMKEPRFRDTLDERGQKMLARLVKLQESVNGNLGYSQLN